MLSKIRLDTKIIPFILLGLCWISYGIYIHRLGFYWDDWPSIWFYHLFGPESYKIGFAVDRPMLAWIFMLTTSILGESTLAWQIFAMLTRWLTVLALWWTLQLLWPGYTKQVTGVALLFAVYPGFRQHYIAVTYGNAFLVYAIFLVSLGIMILAIRRPRWFWPLILLSLFCSATSMFISEYFFGLELLRPVLLWMAQDKPGAPKRKRLSRIGLQWSPYLAIMIAFVVWRFFLHTTPRGQVIIFDQLRQSPVWALFDLGKTILLDVYKVSLAAWSQALQVSAIFDYDPPVIRIYFGVILAAAILSFFLLTWLAAQSEQGPLRSFPNSLCPPPWARQAVWARQSVLLGLYALLIAGWPFWVTNLHIDLFFPWDRFTMPMMIGVSLLFAGLIEFLGRWRWPGLLAITILVSLAAGMHFYDTMAYRQEWLLQKDFLWQLAWRAPGIEAGATIITSELPFIYYSDNSLTAPLNWTYAPDNSSHQMDYLLADMEARLGNNIITSLEPGTPVYAEYRATTFEGNTSLALVLFYDPPRCLKVVHPVYDLNLPYKPLYIRDAMPLSNLELIQVDAENPARPPSHIFGPEPVHEWCYYFEKAELASQAGDWSRVVALAEPALKLKTTFNRKTAPELIPFIKGYAYTGQWEQAAALSRKAYESGDKMQYLLCNTWYTIEQDTQPDPGIISQIYLEFECSQIY